MDLSRIAMEQWKGKTKGDWGQLDVSVTLTGEEWTALLARLGDLPLSRVGRQVLVRAGDRLRVQVKASTEGFE